MLQCRDIEEVLEQAGLGPLPEAAGAHVARCLHCQDYIADLETIVSAAHELPEEGDPLSAGERRVEVIGHAEDGVVHEHFDVGAERISGDAKTPERAEARHMQKGSAHA